MRRATLLVLATIAGMLLATGVAVALTKTCPSGTNSDKPCKGTDDADILTGTNGADYIRALKGNDVIVARAGTDRLYGDDGADALFGQGDNDIIDGGAGNDNFKTQFNVDPNGPDINPNPPFGAGLRGGPGNDSVYGGAGDDDVIGNAGTDTLDDSSSSGDWDRAFGATGDDTINVADGDLGDEVSCGENITSPNPSEGDNDTVTIDVVRDPSDPAEPTKPGKISAADTVHEEDAEGNAVTCETIKAKDQDGQVRTVRDQGGTYEELPPPTNATAAAVEPA